MYLEAYHKALMQGATEEEAVRIEDDAYYDCKYNDAMQRKYYDALYEEYAQKQVDIECDENHDICQCDQ